MIKSVGIWGFYEQGNLGDDLMAIMFYDLVCEAGFEATIVSNSDRFRRLGYNSVPDLVAGNFDAVVIGGGAFFKGSGKQGNSLDSRVGCLLELMDKRDLVVIAMSVGSDGVHSASEISPIRRRVVQHPRFKAGFVRLRRDQRLDLTGFRFLPDIILASAHHFVMSPNGRDVAHRGAGLDLYNFTRRSIPQIPNELWRMRGQKNGAIFLSHTTTSGNGGEVRIPCMRIVDSDNLLEGVAALANCRSITSSKLHPGLTALSYGAPFRAITPRDKTTVMIAEYEAEGIIHVSERGQHVTEVKFAKDSHWQQRLWEDYRSALSVSLKK